MGSMLALHPKRKGESAVNIFKVFTLVGDYNKLQSINKEKGTTMNKLPQYLTLAVSLIGTLGVPAYAKAWLVQPSHLVIYTVLVAAAIVLHSVFPSIFSAPSDADKSATGLNKVGIILLILGLGMAFPASTRAQTTTTATSTSSGFSATSEAVAVRYAGEWSAGTHITESYDLVDFGKTKANHLYVQGHELLAPTPGISIYAGGLQYEPDLTALLKKTNVASTNFGVYINGAVGNGVPTSGGSHISFLAGGGVKYALTSALTWQSLNVQYFRYGSNNGAAISTGLSFIFGK
jgi:hypothetical protein